MAKYQASVKFPRGQRDWLHLPLRHSFPISTVAVRDDRATYRLVNSLAQKDPAGTAYCG